MAEIDTAKLNQEKIDAAVNAQLNDPTLIQSPYLRSLATSGKISKDKLEAALRGGIGGRMSDVTSFLNQGTPQFNQVGAMADGTPIYGWDAKGNPVTSPTGTIYSTTSSSDAVSRASSGAKPIVSTSGATGITTTAATTDALLAFNKAQAAAETQSKRESAFGVLKKEFDKYGLGSLVDSVKNLILTGSSPEEVVLTLRTTPEYLKRFAGNKLRLDAGLNVYDEATYLDLENAYDQIFTSYGVEEAVGNTRAARQAKYAEFIGGTKSPDEIKGRVQLAVLASQEDAVTKATMKELYPMLTDKDLVSYFLNPKETLPKLETKIRSAQVGAAAVRQGLVTNVATAEELVGLGVTEEEAERAYSAYAYDKPRIDLLSGLDPTKDNLVDQQVAEGALLKNLASEQRKLDLLKQKELGRFGGTSGAIRDVSLSKQVGRTY